jgi:hypothetical protein
MPLRNLLGAALPGTMVRATMLLAAALLATLSAARAFDESIYPDWKGSWSRIGAPRWDASKPELAQEPPLTAEYQAVFAASRADIATGGQGSDPTYTCLAPGMPRSMIVYHAMEIVITPATVYILIDHIHDSRRIFTDGRDWPEEIEPSFAGYAIGRWIDSKADGRHDVLEVETRNFKGPRTFDSTSIPLHRDNQTIVRERIHLDPADRGFLVDEITVIDHALTHPWTVNKRYRRDPAERPSWIESVCAENNNHVEIGKQGYMLSADGLVMPAKKDQPPPDLRYFKPQK